MQKRREIAQRSVREDHQPVDGVIATRREHPAPQDDRPTVAHHPPLASELAFDRGHHLLGRPGLGHVHGAPSPLDHFEGEREIVTHDRIDHQIGLSTRRINRPVATGH